MDEKYITSLSMDENLYVWMMMHARIFFLKSRKRCYYAW
jgi:hypothetical protein